MSNYPAKEFEIALWTRTFQSGKVQLQGKIEAAGNPLHGKRVKAWLDTDKRNPSAPDYRVVLDDWEPGQTRDRGPAKPKPPVEDMDDEIPF